MAKVSPGRFTAHIEGPFVVFRLGIRINSSLLLWKWFPTLRALVPILRILLLSDAPGLLGTFSIFYLSSGRGIIQYWRSLEELEQFVLSQESPYREFWRRYHQSPGSDGSVGVWYEMFLVESKRYEVVYDNMPVSGLAAASEHVPAVGRRETARRRLGRGYNDPAVPSPPNPIY
jgi:hypothetical protein